MKISSPLVISVAAVALLSALITAISAKTLLDVLADSGPANQSSPDMFLFNEDQTDFNIMRNFLLLAGLTESPVEEEVNGFTIFAPNDGAFIQTAMDLGLPASSKFEVYQGLFLFLSRGYNDPIESLQQMILFHVLPGKMKILLEGGSSDDTGLLDAVLYARGVVRINMKLIDMNLDLPDPNVVLEMSNKEVSRSILHVIDRMLFFQPVNQEEFAQATHEQLISPEPSASQAELDSSVEPSPEVLVSPETFIDLEGSIEPLPEILVTVSPGIPTVSNNPNQPPPSPSDVNSGHTSIPSNSNSPTSEMPSSSLPESQPENTSSPDTFSPTVTEENVPVESMEEMQEFDYISVPESSPMPVPMNTNVNDTYVQQQYQTEVMTNIDSSEVESTQTPNPEPEFTSVSLEGHLTLEEIGGDDSDITLTELPSPDTNAIGITPEIHQTPEVTLEIASQSANIAESTQPIYSPPGDVGPFPEPSMIIPITNTAGQDTLTEVEPSQDPTWTSYAEEPTMEPSGESEDVECFPISASVHLSSGEDIPISQLLAGHKILVTESMSSVVYLFSHKRQVELHDFIMIKSEGNHSITLSQGHYIYANGKLKVAKKVKVGDVLRTLDGGKVVQSVEWTQDYGLVAPHTLHGDIVVNRIVASTYTSALHPVIAHSVLWPLRILVHLGMSKEPLGTLLYDGFPLAFRSAQSSEQTCTAGSK